MKSRPPAEHAPAPPRRDGRRENAAHTQAALCAAGRKLFGRDGYEATSVGALCAEAGVTTGALYHHYGDKKGLFAAVAEQLDAGLVGAAAATRAKHADPWAAFIAGIDAVLAASGDAGGRRIGLTDAPAVLGAAWTEIRERHGLGAMIRTVEALQAHALLPAGDPRRLARIVLGALYGAIEALPARGSTRAAALDETRRALHAMLEGLRGSGRRPSRAARQRP